ncbi:hypothetical protein GCM10023219_16110 [Stakelama sediminis]|uniref:Putative auto-transporter adhesin head GIN domain-containing protein n=1 Tax=Stakelama sediminis TaxID=463200 RepID=A0A840YX88_9SPHN|nr:head GIN domain-containing protein [Stakelama sediminis]MBB5718341.1 hypothetical protein [Stakelama sediminis]
MIRLFAALLLLMPLAAHADSRNIMLTDFSSIRVDGPFRVTVATGLSQGAEVSGDQRAIDRVDVRVQGTTLIISASPNAWGGWPGKQHTPATIAVKARSIREAAVRGGGVLTIDSTDAQHVNLTVTGSGSMTVGAVHADNLAVTLVGSGSVRLAGEALQARFANSGTGRIDADGLDVHDLKVVSEGPGESRFHADRSADVTALGLGNITVSGGAACTVRGPGPVQCDHTQP